jgi:hypothetical protein
MNINDYPIIVLENKVEVNSNKMNVGESYPF